MAYNINITWEPLSKGLFYIVFERGNVRLIQASKASLCASVRHLGVGATNGRLDTPAGSGAEPAGRRQGKAAAGDEPGLEFHRAFRGEVGFDAIRSHHRGQRSGDVCDVDHDRP